VSQYKPYPKYKPSGVEWIGDIPEGWGVKRLANIGIFSSSGIDKKNVEGEPLVSMINYTDIYGNKGRTLNNRREYMLVSCPENKKHEHQVKCGDLIFTPSSETIEDIGLSAVVDEDLPNTVFSYHVVRFVFTEVVYHEYKKYLCNNLFVLSQFSKLAKGTTRQILGRFDFRSIRVVVPPLVEQQKIADFLDKTTERIDALIDKKEKMVKVLKEKRSAIINQAVTKGLDPNAKMKPSGIDWIGDIPEGWKIQRIKFISSVISKGTTPSTIGGELLMDGPVRFIKAENIQGGEIKENPDFFIDEETNKYLKRSELQEGDILFVIAGATIGKTGILEDKFLPANTNQAVSFIRLKREVDNSYVLYWLQSVYIKQITWLDAVQSAQPNLSMESLGDFSIPFSSNKKEQQNIVRYLDQKTGEIDDLIDKTSTAIKKLFEYRTAIITAAVTGKIDAREEKG